MIFEFQLNQIQAILNKEIFINLYITQFVGIIVMNKTYTQPQKEWLPPLPGHKKLNKTVINKAAERKHSEEDSTVNQNRLATSSDKQTSHLRLTSERKTSQSGTSSRGVKCETANALCLKKIEILERQNAMLDKQLLTVKEEINKLRVSSRIGEDDSVTISSKATTRRSEERLFQKTDSRAAINRLDVLRSKIDKQNQKNRKIQKEIDKVRKEIYTTKKLNEQIQTQLKDATQRYKQEENLGSVLDEKISSKNEQLRLKKIESIHQQAHLIKDYDSILKKIEKQLGDKEKTITEVKESRAQFYITNIAHSNQRQSKSSNVLFAQNTPRAKKTAAQMTFLKEKISQHEAQFKELRQKTGSETIEEVTKKFLEEYEGNFGVYIFINQMNSHLKELKQRNAQLQLRQQQIKSQFEQKRKSRAFNELEAAKAKIAKITDNQQQIKAKLQNCNSNYRTLKEFVVSFMDKIPLQEISKKYKIDKTNADSLITPQNLLQFLQEILKFKQLMDNIKQGEERHEKHGSHLTSTNYNADNMINSTRSNLSSHLLEQYLQTAKKQTIQDKEQLFNREDFLRNKDAMIMRKKPSASKLRVSKS